MRVAFLSLVLLGLLAAPARAEVVFETLRVPTVGGAEIAVEVMRDDSAKGPVPVLLTYSPYNVLGESRSGNLANDALGRQFVPRGYARAVADVLGTRNSSGCWDYGGRAEQRSGVDLVKFLARRRWSSGRVGMIGGSYDGTTATMVAAQGDAVSELKAIVPIAAISRWYGYAYGNGVRYALNSEEPTDEGLDTPLAFDFGFARTPPSAADDPKAAEKVASRVNPCESVRHTEKGYDSSPDYDAFWSERDFLRRAPRFRAATLVAHGWQDYNVKQEEGVSLFEALPVAPRRRSAVRTGPGVPLKRLYLTQGTHGSPGGPVWNRLLERFLDRYLLGRSTGVEATPAVLTEGRSVDDAGAYVSTGQHAEAAWPPQGTRERRLLLGAGGTLAPDGGRSTLTWTGAPTTEETTTKPPQVLGDLAGAATSLFFATAPLERAQRIAGAPVLDAAVRVPDHGHLTPVLVDVAPDGTRTTIARGFLNVDFRRSLERAEPAGGQVVDARVRFLPQDVTVRPGHRIGLLVQSANTVWALPGAFGPNELQAGRSSLRLPLAPVR